MASFGILKSLSHATWQKTKILHNQLQLEPEQLFSNYEESYAKRIWRRTGRQIKLLQYDLLHTECRKFKKTTPYISPSYDSYPPTDNTTRGRSRRFCHRHRGIQDQDSTNAGNDEPGQNAQDLNPINLSSTALTNAESTLLTKGPAFCPVPKDVHWQKVINDLDNFDKRIRLAVFHHNKDRDDDNREEESCFPAIRSTSNWMPPKSAHPEVELFLNNVRKDILEQGNLRKPGDNLTKEERLALRSLKQSDNIIRIQDKGSRFVILNWQEYHSKILGQLNNSLHYDKVDSDPTLDHFDQVKNWGRKWLSEGQNSQEIATWITNLEPKPGVAFGNVKTHKRDNPLRLITSCCGTAIEWLSALTEFYLKPLSQNLPSFIKDSTDLINKIQALNAKGPFPVGSLLVSWDVVSMFPNIDNNLGITAVTKALDSRSSKFPSTDCIAEAVEICLRVNNCHFSEQNFVSKTWYSYGTKKCM